MTINRNQTRYLRKSLSAALLTGALVASTTGCSGNRPSFSSLNPFAKSNPPVKNTGTPSKTGPTAIAGTIASGTKNAIGKSRDTLVGWFQGGDSEPVVQTQTPASTPDPLRLDKKSEASPEVFVANGRLWESTGNFEKAMTSYTQALEKQPNHPGALTMIARLHYRQGNHKQAADYFGKAIEQNPKDAGLYNDLGITLSKLGNHDLATRMLERSLDIAPGTSRYANSLASIRFDAGDPNGAFKVLATNNKPAVAHFNMAYLHYRKGQSQKASEQLALAMQYRNAAANDKATARAVARSEELLAQIQGKPAGGVLPQQIPGQSSRTAIAQSATPSNVTPASAGTGQATHRTVSQPMMPNHTIPARTASQTTPSRQTTTQQPGYQGASYRTPAQGAGAAAQQPVNSFTAPSYVNSAANAYSNAAGTVESAANKAAGTMSSIGASLPSLPAQAPPAPSQSTMPIGTSGSTGGPMTLPPGL